MRFHDATVSRTIMIRIDPGEDLLEAMQRAVADSGVQNGVFVSGVGSLSSYHFHVVSTPVLPPENAFIRGNGPFDILTVTGGVLGGRVHAHVTFSNTEIAMGGHLEPGCTVLTFAIVCLAEMPGHDLSSWDHVARP